MAPGARESTEDKWTLEGWLASADDIPTILAKCLLRGKPAGVSEKQYFFQTIGEQDVQLDDSCMEELQRAIQASRAAEALGRAGFIDQTKFASKVQRLCAQLGQTVNTGRMSTAMAQFTADHGGETFVNAAAFFKAGFTNFVTGDQFCHGQPVLVTSHTTPAAVGRLGVVRDVAVDSSAQGTGVSYTVETVDATFCSVPAGDLASASEGVFDSAEQLISLEQGFGAIEHLQQRVGRDPDLGGRGLWKRELPAVICEDLVLKGIIRSPQDPAYPAMLAATAWAQSFEAYCEQERDATTALVQRSGGVLALEDAQVQHIFTAYGAVLAAAAREGRRDYAGMTHRYYKMIVRLADGAPADVAECYRPLRSTTATMNMSGLQDMEPEWANLVRSAMLAKLAESDDEDERGGQGGAKRGCELRGTHTMTAAGATQVNPAEPRLLDPAGFRLATFSAGGDWQMEVQDSVLVRFVSSKSDGTGMHTAVNTDPTNCVFPPMTKFTAVDVQLGSFLYDGTDDLVRQCKRVYGGLAPTPVPDAHGRLHIAPKALVRWMAQVVGEKVHDWDWFHESFLPRGVQSSIYVVNRTVVTVKATYLLPDAYSFRTSVAERVGQDPGGAHWKSEVPALALQWEALNPGQSLSSPPVTRFDEESPHEESTHSDVEADGSASSEGSPIAPFPYAAIATTAGIARGTAFEGFCVKYQEAIDLRLGASAGVLSPEDAQLTTIFSIYGSELAAAAREGRRNYAGLTHRFVNMLGRLAATADEPALDCFRHLRDTCSSPTPGFQSTTGLQDEEPGWAGLVSAAVIAADKGGGSGQCGSRGLCRLNCLTVPGITSVSPAEPSLLVPSGYRQANPMMDGEMEVQDSAVVRFISAFSDGAGGHSAVHTDPNNCVFPPLTTFTVVEVQLGEFLYDGTQDLLRQCRLGFDGRAPEPVPDSHGRLHIGREQLVQWLVQHATPNTYPEDLLSDDPDEREAATEYFHETWLPPGVDSTIYNVGQTCITVQATYSPPTCATAPCDDEDGPDSTDAAAAGKMTAISTDFLYVLEFECVRVCM
jgi:hypothetical protein